MKTPNHISDSLSTDELIDIIENTNINYCYSKTLETGKPVNIQMLMPLTDIAPEISYYEDTNIPENTICQLVTCPSNKIHIGYFNENNMTPLYTAYKPFKEGVHFKFV